MNPVDALARDYSLYYHNTWMHHKVKGVGRVTINENNRLCFAKHMGKSLVANPEDLTPTWVRPGAYNINGSSAAYIARRARRSARRSCSTEHYFCKWSPRGKREVTAQMMWAAVKDQPRPSMEEGIKLIEGKVKESVAVTRDIILSDVGRGIGVSVRGEPCGVIEHGVYRPPNEYSPIIKMARIKLHKEGVLC